MKMVGYNDEWASLRKVFLTDDPKIAEGGKGEPNEPAHEAADQATAWIAELGCRLSRIHDSSIAAKRRTAKFENWRILTLGSESPPICLMSSYSLRSKHQISVPPPGWLFTSKVAPIIAARSRMPVRP